MNRVHIPRMLDSNPLTPELFLPYVGKLFRVRDGRHELTLTKVDVSRFSGEQAKLLSRPPFTLIFFGPPRDVLQEGLYTFDVAGEAQFEIYVMPIATPLATRQDYQAVFN
jgi:hypothetical protein